MKDMTIQSQEAIVHRRTIESVEAGRRQKEGLVLPKKD